ncbi:MAG: phosphoribosylglycinamide formyltransferase [Candidatus Auribacterota bacterium]|jgi:phosphoribosylglycinamide formyltransferase-1|nr:phosphoribosylglycinamide formyltransferase [Candidatus Auribacterota bacterium]
MFRLGVIGSGSGTNFQAIASAIANGLLPGVEVAVVISDVKDARILERAEKMNVPAFYIDPGKYRTKLEPQIEQKYANTLNDYSVDLVVLAGFMRMVKHPLLSAYRGRIINIHPSLLPAFPGLASFRQAWEYGVKITGCTVHFVDEGMDTGPIIGQRAVPILNGDTPEDVHARIQVEEHILYPACIKAIAEGRVSVSGRHVAVDSPGDTVNVV